MLIALNRGSLQHLVSSLALQRPRYAVVCILRNPLCLVGQLVTCHLNPESVELLGNCNLAGQSASWATLPRGTIEHVVFFLSHRWKRGGGLGIDVDVTRCAHRISAAFSGDSVDPFGHCSEHDSRADLCVDRPFGTGAGESDLGHGVHFTRTRTGNVSRLRIRLFMWRRGVPLGSMLWTFFASSVHSAVISMFERALPIQVWGP